MNHTINEAMIAVEKRKEIDFANVVLCLLVMLIHILSKAVSSFGQDKRAVCGGVYTVQTGVVCCPGLYFFERHEVFHEIPGRRA